MLGMYTQTHTTLCSCKHQFLCKIMKDNKINEVHKCCRQNYTENTEAEVCSFTILLVLLHQSTPIIIYHIVYGKERMNEIYSDKEGQSLFFVPEGQHCATSGSTH